ncbi:MT-A70 family methyltransferase [Bradyrhizobium sp. sGM-13]|uniref:MT-A70 family methyltransferase n=1 Tax=Bradyrhizobium sp. sGM-13 TaxID=2831781 RepID=UPI001BCB6F39|nr:MT-A70 family methyltransferase [Bradyrhizobium sp. sGM-13]
MSWPFGPLRMFGYDVIVADPPWLFDLYSKAGEEKSAAAHYELMTLHDIKALPVSQLASRDCLLLLWTCGWAMATCQAHEVARAWGFEPITEMSWRKTTASGAVRMGPGYRVRTMHEPILVCTTGNPRHRALESTDRFDICIDGLAREHSRKPVEFYEHVVDCTPNALARADLFTRETRPGFDGWGNESTKFDRSIRRPNETKTTTRAAAAMGNDND